MHHQRRQTGYNLIAGRILVGLEQFFVVTAHLRWYLEHHLRKELSVGRTHIGIDHATHMQHHIVVSGITVVAMQVPVGSLLVNLHIAHP